MTKPLRFDDDAVEEMNAAAMWYEHRREHLGLDFVAEVRQSLVAIGRAPGRWPRYEGIDIELTVHRYVLRRFPYAVFYIELAAEVRILAIAHTSRHPGFWRSRL